MGASDLMFRALGGAQTTAEIVAEVAAVHAAAYPGQPAPGGPASAAFTRRFGVHRRQPGFVLAAARHGGYLVGYAAGLPLRPATSWWRDLTSALPEEVTAEPAGRTFALVDLAVRPSWRRQGIGRTLHDLVLANRPEERASLTVPPSAAAAQRAFRSWGWQKVARTRTGDMADAVADVLLLALPVSR